MPIKCGWPPGDGSDFSQEMARKQALQPLQPPGTEYYQ